MKRDFTASSKYVVLTLAFILFSFSVAFSQGKDGMNSNDTIKGIPYFIKVGEGTGGVKLGISTIADAEKLFGKGRIRKEKAKRAGKIYRDRVIAYKKKGLRFFALFDTTNIIYSIEVTMPGARTDKDIVIGTSTQADVLKAYGEPSYRSDTYLGYDNYGVIFEFNHGILSSVLLNLKR